MTTTTTEPTAGTDPARAGSFSDRLAGRFAEQELGLLVIRVIAGVIFVGHGAQKLFGAWNGAGIDGTARFFGSVGYAPAKPIAVLGGLIEFGGGILLILGIGASAAAAALAANMAGATSVSYDGARGAFFAMKNGYEYPLMLALVALGLALTGPGRVSLDDGRVWNAPKVRLGLTGLAIVGALVAIVIR